MSYAAKRRSRRADLAPRRRLCTQPVMVAEEAAGSASVQRLSGPSRSSTQHSTNLPHDVWKPKRSRYSSVETTTTSPRRSRPMAASASDG